MNRVDGDPFKTPQKHAGIQPDTLNTPSPADEFLPLSQKFSLSPLHDEEVSASASELLYSELTEKNQLLKRAQEEAREYKLKCEALLSSLSESKKRQRDDAKAVNAAASEARPDEAPKKKHSPDNKSDVERPSVPPPVPVAPPTLKPADPKPAVDAPSGCQSDDEVPAPDQRPPQIDFVFQKPYERLHSILCAHKARVIIPGSTELPFDLCALMCKEEAHNVEKWSTQTCVDYHKAVISALGLVYPNKIKSWFDKPFLKNPKSAAKYWCRVLSRRAEIWQAAADREAANSLPPPHQEPLRDRIRRKIAERKAKRINSLSVAFTPSASKSRSVESTPKPTIGLSSDSDEASATVIDLSQSPAPSAASAPSCSSSASTVSSDTPPKAAPHPK